MKLALLLCAAGLLAAAQNPALEPPVEDLFKWGEYDSLIEVLEPLARTAPAAPLDGREAGTRARAFLYLGVAYYATGNAARSDSAFRRACIYDPQVRLDRFYVTDEIAKRFLAISREAPPPSPGPKGTPASAAARPAGTPHSPGRRHWLWWGMGATAAAVAGGAWYLSLREPAPKEHVTVMEPGGR